MTKEPEEPEGGSAMEIGGKLVTPAQQWCCDELCALRSRKAKNGPTNIVRNLETLPTSRGARAWFRIVREAERSGGDPGNGDDREYP